MTASTTDTQPSPATVRTGLMLGMIGVVIFGTTMPMTRLAVAELEPLFVTCGRSLVAAACAAAVLIATASRVPPREMWGRFAVFAVMVVLGYPLLMGTAMQFAPASHAGVVLAVQPLLTALSSMYVGGERPSPAFWACSIAGTLTVLTYALISSAGSSALHWADLLLALAAVAGSFGYAVGGQLSRQMPGWLVISWAVVMAAPFMAVLFLMARLLGASGPVNWAASWPAWGGFLYVGVFSMFLGFFPWNKGLAMAGIARVGQVQLTQPFVVLIGAALLLGEQLGWREVVFSTIVVGIVALGTRFRVRQVG